MSRDRLRATFDERPELYDRTRPVCPPELFDDLAALARLRAGARVVEIGCGTGQATLPLASRGFRVVAVELGARLADFARRRLAGFPEVEIVSSSFEGWDAGDERFDAVVAVNSFHWIDPDVRYAKPAALLRAGGALAVVWTPWVVPHGADRFWTDIQQDYDALGPIEGNSPPPPPDAVGHLGDEIDESGFFRNVAVRRYLWDVSYSADEYISLLSTSSWHRALADDARESLFERIHRRIESLPERTVKPTLLGTLNVAERL